MLDARKVPDALCNRVLFEMQLQLRIGDMKTDELNAFFCSSHGFHIAEQPIERAGKDRKVRRGAQGRGACHSPPTRLGQGTESAIFSIEFLSI